MPESLVANTFRQDGDVWRVVYAGKRTHLRDLKGNHYLARLLAFPGEEFHVRDLDKTSSGGHRQPPASVEEVDRETVERTRKAICNRIRKTIELLNREFPDLGLHLRRSIRMGIRCSYVPGKVTHWQT